LWLKHELIRFLDWLIALLGGWRARLRPKIEEEIGEEIEELEVEPEVEPQAQPSPKVVTYPDGAPPPMVAFKPPPAYPEPDVVPDGCVRARYNEGGSVIIKDWRGWSVQIKAGEDLIVTEQTWKNLNDPDLMQTRPGTWKRL